VYSGLVRWHSEPLIVLALLFACDEDPPPPGETASPADLVQRLEELSGGGAVEGALPRLTTALDPLELPDEHLAIQIRSRIVPRRFPGEDDREPGHYDVASIRWDGRAEFSDDRLRGGDPLHTTSVDTTPMRALLDELRRQRVFEDPNASRERIPLHSDWVTVEVNIGEGEPLRLSSAHERPINPVWVEKMRMTGTSMDEAFEAEIADMDPEEQRFRRRWRAIRGAVTQMLPPAPEPEAPPEPPARRPLDLADDHVVILIESHDMRDPEPGGPRLRPNKLITSIRWDGQAQWSDDRDYGDGELRSGSVDRARVRAFIEELREEGTFDDDRRYSSGVPGGSRYVRIRLNLGEEERFFIASVDPHRTGRPLQGRHDFDKMWVRLRASITEMLPASE